MSINYVYVHAFLSLKQMFNTDYEDTFFNVFVKELSYWKYMVELTQIKIMGHWNTTTHWDTERRLPKCSKNIISKY